MKNEVFNSRHFTKKVVSGLMKTVCCFLMLVVASTQWGVASENEVQITQQAKRTITGSVTDNLGEPIIGANVVEVGTGNGTITDLNGRFTLAVSSNATLKISYIGYSEKEVKVGTASAVDVVLSENLKTLDEVVVVGYGTMDKKELTSAISHITNKEFLGVASVDPIMQIQGKVPGLTVTNTASGDPNSGATVQIRGISSRSAGLGPLIVIDGVPGGNMENLNTNDIESIDVLKDGAASAIYGTRGSNGVIVITTKKGTTDGKVRTEYNGYVSLDFAHNELDILSADEFRKYKVDAGMATDFGANTDWLDEITRTGFAQNHNLALTGGNSRTNYRISVDVRDAQAVDIRSDRTDYGARLGFEHTTNGGLFKFSGNITPRIVNRNHSDYDAFNQAIYANPTMPVKNSADITGKSYTQFTGDGKWNPVDRLNTEKKYSEHKNLEWNITAKLNLLPLLSKKKLSNHMLSTQATIAQIYNDEQYFEFRPSYSTLSANYNSSEFRGYGEAMQSYSKYRSEMFEWLVNYNLEKNGHNLGVMGGYSYQQFMNYGFSAENKNFTSDALTWDNLGDGTYMQEEGRNGMASYRNSSKLIAFFGRLTYNYKQRYMFTASLRYEGSSKFGKNNKWGYFPAVSAGWRISDEAFMKDIKWINNLKLRADFGVTGNQDFDPYLSLATYAGYGESYFNGQYYKGWGSNKNPNPDLKWEKGLNWNVGIDFELFNILSGSINYYNRTQKDLLGSYKVPLPPYIWDTMFVNVGTMRNTGIEVDLNIQAVKTKDFSYNIGLVGSTENNKFLNFSNQTYTGQDYYETVSMVGVGNLQRISIGERIGNYYTYRYAGVDDNGNWLVYNKDNEVIPISEAQEQDKTVGGNGLPKFSASFNNTFVYKNFDLSVYFRGVFGFDIFNVHEMYYGLQAVNPPYNGLEKAFTDNKYITNGQQQLLDYFIEKGDYVKLDVLSLGYTLNLNKKWLERIRVYATAKNLFTITGFSGIDPAQYPTTGLTPGTFNGAASYYPSTTQVLFGVQISF